MGAPTTSCGLSTVCARTLTSVLGGSIGFSRLEAEQQRVQVCQQLLLGSLTDKSAMKALIAAPFSTSSRWRLAHCNSSA